MKKPKTVELTLRVRVPAHMTAGRVRREIADQWYGEVIVLCPHPKHPDEEIEVSIYPKFKSARVLG